MTSASNGWAVGSTTAIHSGPLVLRWNGSTWAQQPLPRVRGGWLSAIAASSARNAWAVGGTGEKNLILHWNGRRWSRLPCPTPHHDVGLIGVTVMKSGAAWAVGFGDIRGGLVDVILRWTGGKWKQAANPAPMADGLAEGQGTLADVAASSDRNAWVVGTGAPGIWTVAAHWNGSVWRQSPMPNIYGGLLESVAVAPRHQAWAVGRIYGSNGRHSVLIMHWNGRSWRRVKSPNPPGATLGSVAVLPDGTAWAVGATARGTTFVLYWNRHSWRHVASPNFTVAGASDDFLASVSAVSPSKVWAVGFTGGGGFIISWNGSRWQ